MKNKKDPFDLKPVLVTPKRAALALKRLAKMNGVSVKKMRKMLDKISREVMKEINNAEN